MVPYPYQEGNARLLESLNLLAHPEGGYYAETVRTKESIPSEFADGAERSLATEIYYLLTPSSAKGKMHMNKSITFHTLHQGRALYTLVKPLPADAAEGGVPEIKQVVMGADSSKGEVRQLLVEGGWWKASEIPAEDLAYASSSPSAADSIGCLISEVVVPGFDFADHCFLTSKDLEGLFKGESEAAKAAREKLKPYVREE
ncbi:hypothetical protein JCM8097_009149 [Rhodosporidiobolus ruineniae]